MEELLTRKERIVEKHVDKLSKNYLEVLKLKEKATSDRKFSIDVGLGIFDNLKTLIDIKNEKLLNMNSEDRSKYAQKWSEDAKYIVENLKNHPGYESLLKDVDRLIRLHEEEIRKIDEELGRVEDEYKRMELERRRTGVMKKK